MRPRETIEFTIEGIQGDDLFDSTAQTALYEELKLEVLLDIRDLLSKDYSQDN